MRKDYQDARVLQALYVEQEMTQPEIADIFDINHGTISYWLDKHNIDARPPKTPNLHAGYCEKQSYGYNSGYYVWVSLDPDGKVRRMSVHRLLAVAEYGVDEVADKQVHHKNGIPWDNRPENIEPLTAEEHSKEHEDDLPHVEKV
jgi:hypothetical protein